jgi:hypothetical protein
LAIRAIRIAFDDGASTITYGGDAVLLVAMIIPKPPRVPAHNRFVDVAGVDISVRRAARCCTGWAIGDGLLAVLEVNDIGCTVVAADSAAKRVELVENAIHAVVGGAGSDQLVFKIPGQAGRERELSLWFP